MRRGLARGLEQSRVRGLAGVASARASCEVTSVESTVTNARGGRARGRRGVERSERDGETGGGGERENERNERTREKQVGKGQWETEEREFEAGSIASVGSELSMPRSAQARVHIPFFFPCFFLSSFCPSRARVFRFSLFLPLPSLFLTLSLSPSVWAPSIPLFLSFFYRSLSLAPSLPSGARIIVRTHAPYYSRTYVRYYGRACVRACVRARARARACTVVCLLRASLSSSSCV